MIVLTKRGRVLRLVAIYVGLGLLAGLVARVIWGLFGLPHPWVAGLTAVPVATFIGTVHCAWPAIKKAWELEGETYALRPHPRWGPSAELQAAVEALTERVVVLEADSARQEAELRKAEVDLGKAKAELKETKADVERLKVLGPFDTARYLAGWILAGLTVVTSALSTYLWLAGAG
jgi:hypothetical protein